MGFIQKNLYISKVKFSIRQIEHSIFEHPVQSYA